MEEDFIPFVTVPSLSRQQWTAGYNYKCLNRSLIKHMTAFPNTYFVNSADGLVVESTDVIVAYQTQMESCDWVSFDEFVNCALGLWKISHDPSEPNWILSMSCTCPIFYKQYVCKHIIAIALILHLVEAPNNAMTEQITGEPNKRGRPPTILPVLPRHGFRPIIQSLSSNEHVYDNDITTVDCDKSNDCDDMIQPPQLDQRQPYLFNHFPPHLSFVNTDSNDSNTNLTNVEFDHSGLAFAQMSIAPANSTARDLLFTTFTEAEIDYHHSRYQLESATSLTSVASVTSSDSISLSSDNTSQPTRSLLLTKCGRKPDTAEVKAAKEAKKLEAKEAKKKATQAQRGLIGTHF